MKYLTIKQASKILKISVQSVRRKIILKNRCPFPSAIKPGHDWLILESEVMKEKEYRNKLKYIYKPIRKVKRVKP